MKNKKFIYVAAMAAVMSLGFTACSQDDDISGVVSNNKAVGVNVPEMGFNATVGTPSTSRGTAILAANKVANFQVFGFLDDGTQYVGSSLKNGIMIDGTLGTGDDAANYVSWGYRTASDVAYWPQANVRFQAISPAEDTSISIDETALATGVDFSGYTPAGTADCKEQKLTATVTVPTTVANQKDIMFAKTGEDGTTHTASANAAVGLSFDHALSQVVFSGKVASDKIAVDINDIKVMNAYQKGKVGYFGTNQALAASTSGYFANQDFSIGLADHDGETEGIQTTLGAANTSTAKNLTATDGALFMIPQTVSAWATTAASAVTVAAAEGTESANGQGILAISCKITSAGQYLVGDADNYQTVYIPFAINWAQGKKYIYTLVFGKGSGAFDEDGKPLDTMLPITYTVSSVTAWDEVTPDAIEF